MGIMKTDCEIHEPEIYLRLLKSNTSITHTTHIHTHLLTHACNRELLDVIYQVDPYDLL